MRNHRLYEVRSDKNVGGWKVVTGKGTCLKRATTRREAVSSGRAKARNAAADFGINTTFRVRNMDGTIAEERSFAAVKS